MYTSLTTSTVHNTHTAPPEKRPPFSDIFVSEVSDEIRESEQSRTQLPLLFKLLSQLDSEDLTPEQRLAAIRHLKRPLMLLAGTMARPRGVTSELRDETAPRLDLAQRLFQRICRNLDHVLIALDRRRFAAGTRDLDNRQWTIRQLLKFLGYQIEYGVLGVRPLPPLTWQRLHDLFSYLTERGDVRVGEAPAPGSRFDPERAYKRLLLLSLIPELSRGRVLTTALFGQLPTWAQESRLLAPAAYLGRSGLLVVETSKDAPPRWRQQPVADTWRGWVLETAPAFLDAVGFQRPVLSLDDGAGLIGDRPTAPAIRYFAN